MAAERQARIAIKMTVAQADALLRALKVTTEDKALMEELFPRPSSARLACERAQDAVENALWDARRNRQRARADAGR